MLCATLAALGAPAVRAEHPNAVLALRLVSAMGIDEQMALDVHAIGERLFRTGKLDEAGRDCLRGVDRSAFTPLLQQAATRELTGPELLSAVEYFESSAGRKDLRITAFRRFSERASELGLRMPDISPSEHDAMRAFGQTPAGIKLLERGVLVLSSPASEHIARKTRQLIGECRNRD